jgi:histidine ammonia-lyase
MYFPFSEEDTKALQYNLLMSHSVGVGDFVDKEISKLMLILKVHSLALGYIQVFQKKLSAGLSGI